MKPDFAQAHYNLGLARARSGASQAAIRAFQDSMRCQPADAAAHVALAEELLGLGQSELARDHLGQALQLDPNSSKARVLRDRLPARPPQN